MADGSQTPRSDKAGSHRLGKSPITGHYVLRPATKPSVSAERIREAVERAVADQKR